MRRVSLIVILVCPLFLIQFAHADSFTFQTMPVNGGIWGSPGEKIGWGYSIVNESQTLWLVTMGLDADPFLDASPSSLFDFPIVAPGAQAELPYDGSNGFGLYEITWDQTALIGFVNSGNFGISAWWYDPLTGEYSDAGEVYAPYSATVVPEPSTLIFLTVGLAGVLWRRRR